MNKDASVLQRNTGGNITAWWKTFNDPFHINTFSTDFLCSGQYSKFFCYLLNVAYKPPNGVLHLQSPSSS